MTLRPYNISDWQIEPSLKKGNAVTEFFLPRNPVTGKRQINPIPHRLETALGKALFSLQARQYTLSFECKGGLGVRAKSYQQFADEVLNRLIPHVPQCYGKTWPFTVTVISSNDNNAFAYPGGNIVVTDTLMRNIFNLCRSRDCSEILINDPQWGAFGKLDLSDVTPEDVLAALIGHEMTHVCARHSVVSSTIQLIALALLLSIAFLWQLATLQLLATAEKKGQIATSKENKSHGIQFKYSSLNQMFMGMPFDLSSGELEGPQESKALQLLSVMQTVSDYFSKHFAKLLNFMVLHRSRANEYESDKFGMIYSARAGFDPRGAVFLQELSRSLRLPSAFELLDKIGEFRSTHPLSDHRLAALIKEIKNRSPELILN